MIFNHQQELNQGPVLYLFESSKSSLSAQGLNKLKGQQLQLDSGSSTGTHLARLNQGQNLAKDCIYHALVEEVKQGLEAWQPSLSYVSSSPLPLPLLLSEGRFCGIC